MPSKLIILLLIFSNILWVSVFNVKKINPPNNNLTNQIKYQPPSLPFIKSTQFPNLLAQNYILIDNDTNTILLSKKTGDRIYPASTTKLATALTALNIYPLEEVVTVPNTFTEGQVMSLLPGEKITIKSLVSALLVYSANDSAYNLAKHYTGDVTGFVDQMNNLLAKYGLKDTHFVNFDGLHDSNHYSTVYDLSQLARIAIKNPVITDIVKNKSVVVASVDNKNQHHLESTNELLGIVPEIEGLKTGWTPEAGGCFVGLININGHKLISVVAQSSDRFADTRQLVDWAKQNIVWNN